MGRRLYYGWYDAKAEEFRLSTYPADAPVRPSVAIASMEDVKAILQKRRAEIMWWPPLPERMAK